MKKGKINEKSTKRRFFKIKKNILTFLPFSQYFFKNKLKRKVLNKTEMKAIQSLIESIYIDVGEYYFFELIKLAQVKTKLELGNAYTLLYLIENKTTMMKELKEERLKLKAQISIIKENSGFNNKTSFRPPKAPQIKQKGTTK